MKSLNVDFKIGLDHGCFYFESPMLHIPEKAHVYEPDLYFIVFLFIGIKISYLASHTIICVYFWDKTLSWLSNHAYKVLLTPYVFMGVPEKRHT